MELNINNVVVDMIRHMEEAPKIIGTGFMKQIVHNVQNFDMILLKIPATAKINTGTGKSEVIIKTLLNLHDMIEVFTYGNSLVITLNEEVYFTPDLVQMVINLPAKIRYAEVFGNGILFNTSRIDVASDFETALLGSGSLRLNVNTIDTLKTSLRGTGKMNIAGKVRQLACKVTGSCKLNAKKLVADRITATITGRGILEINTIKELTGSVSELGRILTREFRGKNLNNNVVVTGPYFR